MAQKLDGKKVLADADASGLVHRIKPGWRRAMIFAGVLTCLLIIGIPFGIWFIIAATKARIGMNDEGFAVHWLTVRAYRWEDIEQFAPGNLHIHVHGAGLVGALVGAAASATIQARTQGLKAPLQFKLKGKRGWKMFPAHAVQNSVEMAREMERRTGLAIFPPEPEAAPEAG